MNAPKKKKGLAVIGGGGKKQKILQMLVLVGILLLIFGGIMLFLQRNSGKESDQLYQIVASQQDIVDLINTSSSQLRTTKLLNDSATTIALVSSQSNEINSYLSKYSLNKTKKIASYRNNQYKQVLQDARASGKFEETYTAVLANRLDAYRTLLRAAYATTNNNKLKTILSNDYGQLAALAESQDKN